MYSIVKKKKKSFYSVVSIFIHKYEFFHPWQEAPDTSLRRLMSEWKPVRWIALLFHQELQGEGQQLSCGKLANITFGSGLLCPDSSGSAHSRPLVSYPGLIGPSVVHQHGSAYVLRLCVSVICLGWSNHWSLWWNPTKWWVKRSVLFLSRYCVKSRKMYVFYKVLQNIQTLEMECEKPFQINEI